jgi:hypothetical protein
MSNSVRATVGRAKNLYLVDFISFEDFFQKSFIKSLSRFSGMNIGENFTNGFVSCKEAINPKYYSFNGIDWSDGNVIIFWATPIIPLPIHNDVSTYGDDFKLGNGLNFNLFNSSTVNFYRQKDLQMLEKSDLNKDLMTDEEKAIAHGYSTSDARIYTTEHPPIETYNIAAGDTYIINTVTPHQLFAEPGRICVSVRCKAFNNTPWELMVSKFRDSIKR